MDRISRVGVAAAVRPGRLLYCTVAQVRYGWCRAQPNRAACFPYPLLLTLVGRRALGEVLERKGVREGRREGFVCSWALEFCFVPGHRHWRRVLFVKLAVVGALLGMIYR